MLSIDRLVNAIRNESFDLTRKLIIPVLQKIRRPDSTLPSSWHPLGFLIFKLGTSANKQLRLHIWPQTGIRPAEPNWQIHNHIFELTSCVLSGSVFNREFTVKNDPVADHRLFRVVYASVGTVLEPTERTVTLSVCSFSHVQAGSFYSIKAGEFHCSEPEQECFTASLVITSIPEPNQSPLVVGSNNFKHYECLARSASSSESALLLDQLLVCLTN